MRLRNVSDLICPAEPLDDLSRLVSSIPGIVANQKDLLVETIKPGEQWAVYRPTDISLRLHAHNGTKWEKPCFFPIDRNATLATLQEALVEKTGIPVEKQLITRDAGRSYYHSEPLIVKGDGSRLLWDLGFSEGIRVYVEPAEDVNVATPKALAEIERAKNSFTLYHNVPPSTELDHNITVDKRTTFGELKALLAAVRSPPRWLDRLGLTPSFRK